MPSPANPQSGNRFAYAFNNPLKYIDPSGHLPCMDFDENDKCVVEPYWNPGGPLPTLEYFSGNNDDDKTESKGEDFDPLDYCSTLSDPTDCYKNYKFQLYYNIGYEDVSDLAYELPYRNPLADAYDLSYWNPEFIMNKTSENELFLQALKVDHSFYPNYESIYLGALKTHHSKMLITVQKSIQAGYSEDADALINDFFGPDQTWWANQFRYPWPPHSQ